VTTDDAYVDGRVHQVASKIPGTIKGVPVNDNQYVKKGDLLAEIDSADYAMKANEAEAAYLAERAKSEEAEAKVSSSETNLEVQATNLRQALIDRHRAERLFTEGAYPKEKLEKMQTAAALAGSQVKAAKEQIVQAKAVRDLESALIKQREAALNAAKLNVSYTKLYAPADGAVTKKSVEDGNQVQAGQPLMAVVALDDVWVTANFKETQLKDVRTGQPVVINVDTYAGQALTGKVDSVMAGTGAAFSLFPAENASGNYVKVVQRIPVKIVLDEGQDSKHLLRVGMSVVAKVKVKE
jgi:membrane fusion protein (multidrug efflux system)